MHPYVPCFCPLRSAMREQSRCSRRQIVLNLLVVYYFSSRCMLATLVDLQTSLSSFFCKDFQGGLILWYLPCVFAHAVASDSTPLTVAAWIRGFPQIMIVANGVHRVSYHIHRSLNRLRLYSVIIRERALHPWNIM